MNVIVRFSPRAFAVRWRDVERWSVGSFVEAEWHWPTSVIRPLSAALSRKLIAVERDSKRLGALRLVTLHFDGEMEPRDQNAGENFKGRLFRADPGDVVYSKIDVRNGAIGIIPEEMGRACVSSEYPVYAVDPSIADARYIKLVFRTAVFRRKINSMISGASGRKRVQPSDLESIAVPLPPLAVQRTIVAAHDAARHYAARAAEKIERLERDIETRFLLDLGLSAPENVTLPKAFAVFWSELERWGVDFNHQVAARLNPATGKYPVVRLAETIADLENGWSPKCMNRPAQANEWGVLKMGAVSFGSFDEGQNKALPPTLNGRPNLEVRAGDFLISRANITRLVGACALIRQARPRLMLCDKIFRAVWRDPSPIDAHYLDEVLKIPHLRQQIEGAVTGTSATMKNITKPSLMTLRLPLPPLPVQQAMMKRVEAGRAEIARLRADAQARTDAANAEIEAMILGPKLAVGT